MQNIIQKKYSNKNNSIIPHPRIETRHFLNKMVFDNVVMASQKYRLYGNVKNIAKMTTLDINTVHTHARKVFDNNI